MRIARPSFSESQLRAVTDTVSAKEEVVIAATAEGRVIAGSLHAVNFLR